MEAIFGGDEGKVGIEGRMVRQERDEEEGHE